MEALYELFQSSTGVETDTRKIRKGSLFFCLKGANFDGNTFAEEAIKSGAIGAVIDNPQYHIEGKTILVEDALLTLQHLARHHRNQFQIPVIGITGSNGKTTSKELISAVLATQYHVHFTQGNFNNHIGVPLTLLQLTKVHDIAVIEMGANKPGDIKELVEIALPTHGIITNIGRAHLEGFKSLEGVIKTKTELFDFLAQSKGHIFANKQDETIVAKLPHTTHNHFYNDDSELGGSLLKLTPLVEMEWFESGYSSPAIQTNLVGEYNFINFLAAIRIGRFFGISPENCNKAISGYEPTNNRSQVSKTERNTLIVDCYNANPTSMRSALSSFAKIDTHAKIFILGDMREMGDDAPMVHEEVVQQTIDLRLSGFFIGEEFLKFKGMHPNAIFLKSTEPLIEHFTNNPPADLLILLKGSRGISLEKVIPYL
ncbi:UDP-N-acetylmuramoyl-tripeptide--D-alanyl-D-alanine ligase [Fluviicola chungangensis]|uniref:UDP-N-acetylmuramoyl-tripeptide--D-alanyl-D-alanine ligase n=1 Tax=Fluviicola chungangensis TaxID=2597671 RepID=A0A556MJU3_9FLAO|nr:UDP-N-acetylmuramoyl-tripeptide--D-alanyl-D-alanine ligase [Fluviicola chungangensis]TSJ40143.1 UDP-N-acetylmuramoyl-tripeptide--D-alanyl-D-alanine ligase [Fluviicola chungangensis]